MDGLDLVLAIKDIRASFEHLREAELGRLGGWLAGLEPAERPGIESLTHALVNKVLHRILSGLRSPGDAQPDLVYTAEVARRLLCGDLCHPSRCCGAGDHGRVVSGAHSSSPIRNAAD